SPATITGGSGTSLLSCSGSGGTYTVTVTGTSASLSHSTMVTVNVQDFTLTACSLVSIVQPTSGTNSGTCTITVTSVGGFTGSVFLNATVSPPAIGTTFAFSPTSITGSGTSTLTITISSTTATGSYT